MVQLKGCWYHHDPTIGDQALAVRFAIAFIGIFIGPSFQELLKSVWTVCWAHGSGEREKENPGVQEHADDPPDPIQESLMAVFLAFS
eukprot:363093-Pelagomonas_calceolata.AAC.2